MRGLFLVGVFLYASGALACRDLIEFQPALGESPKLSQAYVEAGLAGKQAKAIADRYADLSRRLGIGRYLRANEVYPLLASSLEYPRFASNLNKLLSHLSSGRVALPQRLENAVRQVLKDRVAESTVERRVSRLLAGKSGALLPALGDSTVEEVGLWLHGGNPLKPTDDSLVGRYLQETGASSRVLSFQRRPEGVSVGPKRLVIALGPESFPTFEKYFYQPELMTVFRHALIQTNGKVFSYANSGDAFRLPGEGVVLPYVILKTTEAERLALYFRLLKKLRSRGQAENWDHPVMVPWLLPGYCAEGGYNNCTHWIGNIPLGDERVKTYAFPDNFENGGSVRPKISGRLKKYEHPEPLMHRVWKVPGHEQFSRVIGRGASNLKGEFASPGWVIQTLLGSTSQERVPIVFTQLAHHHNEIPDSFPNGHEPAY